MLDGYYIYNTDENIIIYTLTAVKVQLRRL